MSGSRMFFDGRRQPAAGRSNFVQTCNLLSRYIKEKGSLRDLNIEIGGKIESVEAIVRHGSTHESASASATMNNFLTSKPSMEQQPASMVMAPILSKDDPKPSQLTIFYAGRVLVFDDYPAEMAEELMAFAKNETSKMSCSIMLNIAGGETNSSSRDGLPLRPQASTSPHTCKEKTNSPATEAKCSDLPIARRSSLHRFLEKRKDRAAVRRPYHQVQQQQVSSSKGDEQLELKL